jgi:hypothetical protein
MSATTSSYAAADVLGRLLGKPGQAPLGALRVSLSDVAPALTATRRFLVTEAPGEVFEPVASGQLDLYEGRVVLASRDGKATVGRLWLCRDARDAHGVIGAGLQPTAGPRLDDGADESSC